MSLKSDDDDDMDMSDQDYDDESQHNDDDSSCIIFHDHLLQIPCSLQIPHSTTIDMTAIIDTGAQVTVMSRQAACLCKIQHLMDVRYKGQATGVGSCRVLGRIPAGALYISIGGCTIKSPAITVLDNNHIGMDLLLGLDFLRENGAILNMARDEMVITTAEQKVVISFVRPKASVDNGGDGWIQKNLLLQDDDEDDNDNDDNEQEHLDMSGV